MPMRVTNHTVVVRRGDKNVRVPPGTAFDFEATEIVDIRRRSPDALRAPVIERPGRPEVTSDEPEDGTEDDLVDDDGDPATPAVPRRAATARRGARGARSEDDAL